MVQSNSLQSCSRSPLLLGSVLILSVLTSACGQGPKTAAAGGFPPLPVKLQVMELGKVQEFSDFVGSLEAKQRVTLRPETEGRIEQILVTEGDRLTQGTLLVQLRPDRNQAEVSAASANVGIQLAALSNAQAEVRVAAAEVARLQAEVKQQAAELQRTEADVELALITYDRTQKLVSQGVLAKQALDDQTRSRRSAIANRQGSEQSLSAAEKAWDAAKERLSAAQARVSQAEATLTQAQADLAATREDLRFNRVIAPIDGMVGDIPVKVGDYVTTSSTLTSIVQNDALDLRVAIPVEQQSRLQLGLPVEIFDSSGSQGEQGTSAGAIATGTLSFISPQADTNAQTLLAKATFPNAEGHLRNGQSVRARVIWEQTSGILVPTVAISRLGGQSFVFVAEAGKTPDGKPQQVARQRPVQLGQIQGNAYQVLDGLKTGDAIVVSGILNLTDGAAIVPETQGQATPAPQ